MKRIKKREKWCKTRHKIIFWLLRGIIVPLSKALYKVKVDRFKEQGKRQYLIVYNHQTAFDQFFISMAFKRPVYHLATEDLFSNGFVSKIIRYIVAPIPIKKQTTDMKAVLDCARVAKEGGTIALSPEGNRTFSGKTEYFKKSLVKLIRLVGLPIAVFKIHGGYGVQPRWSDVKRKGKMHAGVERVIEQNEYKSLSDDELYELLKKELFVNEGQITDNFYHKKSAEYLERAMYVCPECGLSEFYSDKNLIFCKNCKTTVKYLPDKTLKGMGKPFPFRFVNDWYEYQNAFINNLDTLAFTDKPLYTDRACFKKVFLYKRKRTVSKNATVCLFGDKIVVKYKTKTGVTDFVMDFNDVSVVTVLGRNKVNVYHRDQVYQIKGDKRMNALKYVNIFYRTKYLKGENEDAGFLGL